MQDYKKVSLAIVAGTTLYAIYKYSKLSGKEREDLWTSFKEIGKKLVDNIVPLTFKDRLAKNDSIDSHPDYDKTIGQTSLMRL
jgi:hypothetical protein